MTEIILKSERLVAKAWKNSDLQSLFHLCSNEQVMNYFPSALDKKGSQALLARLITCFNQYGFTYFPIYLKSTNEFIGFVGLLDQQMDGEAYIDIGWRLLPEYWGKGYATEMATCALEWARQKKIDKIYAVAPKTNLGSISIMKKIGMSFHKDFHHPKLLDYPFISHCEMYVIDLF